MAKSLSDNEHQASPRRWLIAAFLIYATMLVGLLDRFEIWNPERYEKVRASDAVMAQEAFKMME